MYCRFNLILSCFIVRFQLFKKKENVPLELNDLPQLPTNTQSSVFFDLSNMYRQETRVTIEYSLKFVYNHDVLEVTFFMHVSIIEGVTYERI